MNDDRTKAIIEKMVEDYEEIYGGLSFINDENVRSRAANGLMVQLCKLKNYGKTIDETDPTESMPYGQVRQTITTYPAASGSAPSEAEEPKALKAEVAPAQLPPEPAPVPAPLATEKQIEALRKFASNPRFKQLIAEAVKAKGKADAGQLSVMEASELIATLIDKSRDVIPPGARIETGVRA